MSNVDPKSRRVRRPPLFPFGCVLHSRHHQMVWTPLSEAVRYRSTNMTDVSSRSRCSMQHRASPWSEVTLHCALTCKTDEDSHLAKLVELKSGETFNGHLIACDNFMNLTLKEAYQTSADGEKFWKLAEAYVRGNNIKYIRVAESLVDEVKKHEEEQQRLRNAASSGGGGGGRGGGGGGGERGGRGGGQRGGARGGGPNDRGSFRGELTIYALDTGASIADFPTRKGGRGDHRGGRGGRGGAADRGAQRGGRGRGQ